MTADRSHPGSFRDPSGYVFTRSNVLYRQVNKSYGMHFDHLMESGLYSKLTDAGLLVAHDIAEIQPPDADKAHIVIRPERISFISYPYEWCFSQLKDAAMTALEIQRIALGYGMTLKDASAYNVQFHRGHPVLIDTLSFERYVEGKPWIAYRQFCRHFLAPLAMMSYCDVRLAKLLRTHIDGIPLDLASGLLPFKTRFRFSLLTHIHIHAKSQKKYEDNPLAAAGKAMSLRAMRGLIDNISACVRKIKRKDDDTEWADYYDQTNYSRTAFDRKKAIVTEYLEKLKPTSVWDIGSNTGQFSRLASDKHIPTLSFDVDEAAVEKNYIDCKRDGEENILPLVMDLTNPSPGIGWDNMERSSLLERGPADTVMALALLHHLAISNNLPFERIASFMSRICGNLVIEFIPKSDSQVQRLLASREDIFDQYDHKNFEQAFGRHFKIERQDRIEDSERVMYLMRKGVPQDEE